ncbi:DUF1996 domain-containing protein [Pseudonocardia parietis]|uniref:DUF1996 domain-containing protein n=1 Tax=Pseudonocardia parietis TaxID=570936 RepID=A0ABS4VP27_9PSEU|nr:DUF1996 domain-containing protein [Pseudonocardia parietis]MBP2365665.1 hypothetical protein [Pseudonocardia parietis]
MPRRGRRNITGPVRLVAVVAALLVAAAAVAFGGTASADGPDDGPGSATEQGSTTEDTGDPDDGLFGRAGPDDEDGASGNEPEAQAGRQDDDGEQNDEPGQDRSEQNAGDQGEGRNEGDQNAGNEADEQFPGRDQAAPPAADDFVDITDVEPGNAPDDKGGVFAGGTFTSECGTSDHRNSDNYQAAPGKRNGAQHVHDYVGNTTTDAFSDDQSLEAGGTSCTNGDKSTFYWPVVRDLNGVGDDANADGGGKDGNVGEILTPTSAQMTLNGHPGQKTEPMPQNLRMITGDAKAKTNGDENVVSKWTCSGFTDRTTEKYPICPSGSDLVRFLDFPSCWDGETLRSNAENEAVVFPEADGRCADGRVAIPQLRMTLTYDQPEGRSFALDTFPDQQHSPKTDHGNYQSLLSDEQARTAATCINSGRNC